MELIQCVQLGDFNGTFCSHKMACAVSLCAVGFYAFDVGGKYILHCYQKTVLSWKLKSFLFSSFFLVLDE